MQSNLSRRPPIPSGSFCVEDCYAFAAPTRFLGHDAVYGEVENMEVFQAAARGPFCVAFAQRIIQDERDAALGDATMGSQRMAVESGVLALDVAGVFEALAKSAQPVRNRVRQLRSEAPDRRHCLLRARRERPSRCRTAEQRDELAAFYLIDWHQGPPSVMNSRRHYRSPRRRRGSTV